VTNTLPDNGDGGTKTAAATSDTVTLSVIAKVHAQPPQITDYLSGATVATGTARTLTVGAISLDGGTLSYQWYRSATDSTTGGTAVGTDSASYTVPTDTTGTAYYYVIITNTNNAATGDKTAAVTSNTAKVTVFAAGLTGIMISNNGTDFLDIEESTVPGFAYGVETGNIGEIQTLRITADGLTLSGSGSDVRVFIGDDVGDITFADLSLTMSGGYNESLLYSEGDALTITMMGGCSLVSEGEDSQVIWLHCDVAFTGAGTGASLTVTSTEANGIWCRKNAVFENLDLTVNASGGVDGDWGNGPETKYFQALIVGAVDPGTLTFADIGSCALTSEGGPAVLARDGIVFTAAGAPVDPQDYGVTVVTNASYFAHYTFVGGSGAPLSSVVF